MKHTFIVVSTSAGGRDSKKAGKWKQKREFYAPFTVGRCWFTEFLTVCSGAAPPDAVAVRPDLLWVALFVSEGSLRFEPFLF
jgi:hypothetical protein